MKVAVDRTAEMLPHELRGLEIELEAADQIDVQRVQIREQRLETEPAPPRNAAGQPLASALSALVVERDTIVGVRDFDRRGARRRAVQLRYELARRVGEVRPDFEDRHQLPVVRQRRIERLECVSDSAPLLYRRVTRVAAVDDVPHESPDDSDALLSGHQRSPNIFILNVAIAPTTPAERGRAPGTMRQASNAGLNARPRP